MTLEAQAKAKIPLKGGMLRVNYSSLGLGVVRYDDAQMKGFALPQEIAVGISFRSVKPLLISVQDKWYDWSDALKSFTLIAQKRYSSGCGTDFSDFPDRRD